MNTRKTFQRIKILDFLKSVKTHPTAEKVYEHVKKDIPTITLATVYRNLNLLSKKGDICRIEVNKEYHYDADISCHQHCVCTNCGKIMDTYQKEISEYALKKLNMKGFKANKVNVIFFGTCKTCN